MKRLLSTLIAVLGVALPVTLVGTALHGDVQVSQTCLPNVTICHDGQVTPAGISSCRGFKQADCDPGINGQACVYCDGANIAQSNICVQDHIYTGNPKTCNNTGAPVDCGHQLTSKCKWLPNNGPCSCDTTTGTTGDPCKFQICNP